jgi:hypothetical protein
MRHRPEVLEVRLSRDDYGDRTIMEVWSRMYGIRLGYHLRNRWGDPRRLSDWMERFIGGQVQAWYDAGIGEGEGRAMAQALQPHWERQIHRRMEQFEYEDRYRDRYRSDLMDAMRYGIGPRYVVADDWLGPKEDPKAKEKARQLLMRNLDEGQLKSFKKDGSFRVTAKDGKVYTISTARSFNVKAEDGTRYCGQLADTPVEDQMLAQKLLLQHDPEKFFKNANVTGGATTTATTATEINMRYADYMQNVMIRPNAIIPWDSSV